MRYERKYRVEEVGLEEVLQVLRFHRASFRTLHPDRYINSLYLDTYQFDYYNDNIAGISQRTKQRIRWYGESLKHITKPILEIKLKNGELGTKQYVRLPDFKIDRFFSYEDYMRQHLWLATNNIVPTVMIRYTRSYYQSLDKRFRVTVDRNLLYYPADQKLNFDITPYQDPAIIIEVKYEMKDGENLNIDFLTQDFPFRLTRNSKYVNALMMCY
jgi:SPX domain protein involved in polyphosphate accumulation